MTTLSDIKAAMAAKGNKKWFSAENKRFFGDVSYDEVKKWLEEN